jgi:phage terminase large subunit-like protein
MFDESLVDADVIMANDLFCRWSFSLQSSPAKVIHNHCDSTILTCFDNQNVYIGCKAHCKSKGLYVPRNHYQRYCEECKRWFHTVCIRSWKNRSPPQAINILGIDISERHTDKDFVCMLLAPIERGMSSGVTGNGRAQVILRKMGRDEGEISEDWKDAVGLGYVRQMTGQAHHYYKCPVCCRAI